MAEKSVGPRWLSVPLAALTSLGGGFLLGRRAGRAAPSTAAPRDGESGSAVEPYGQRRRWRLVIGGISYAAFLIFLAWLLPQLSQVIIQVLFAAIIASGIRPLANRLAARGLPLELAVLLIYLVALIVVGLLVMIVVPPFIAEGTALARNLPQYAGYLASLQESFADVPLLPSQSELQGALQDQVSSVAGRVFAAAGAVVSFAADIISSLVVLLIALFFVRDAEGISKHFVGLLPDKQQAQARLVLGEIGQRFRGWLVGSMLLSLSVGSATFVLLTIIGMPYALLLAVIAGVLELVPMIGPFLAAIPAIVVAAPRGWQMVLIVVAIYLLVQQVENNLLVPRIMSSQVNLPSVLVIIALLVGGSLLGIVGAILSVPAAAVVQVLWLRVFVPWLKNLEQHWGAT